VITGVANDVPCCTNIPSSVSPAYAFLALQGTNPRLTDQAKSPFHPHGIPFASGLVSLGSFLVPSVTVAWVSIVGATLEAVLRASLSVYTEFRGVETFTKRTQLISLVALDPSGQVS
jgi:hypothetical protein